MQKLKIMNLILFFAATLALLIPLGGCKGRKVRAELITFTRTIEETHAIGDSLVMEFVNLKFERPEDAPALEAQLNDMIKRINTMLAPIKALKLQTEDIRTLRDDYLRTWESFGDALDLVARVLKTKDKKLGITMDEQLRARMASYEQSTLAFAKNFKDLVEKYGITREDMGITPPPAPIIPFPFSPSPQP